MKVEVSRPHYHPNFEKEVKLLLTKKRDLSVPPHWVANERIEKDGVSYAIVMPPRAEELYEDRQEVHIHMPEYVTITVKGKDMKAKVKVHKEDFLPVVHFDHIEAEALGIEGGEEATLCGFDHQQ